MCDQPAASSVNGFPVVELIATLGPMEPLVAKGTLAIGEFAIGMATVTVAVAVRVSVKVGLAVVDVATGIGVAELVGVADAVADAVLTTVAEADGVPVADALADTPTVGVADVVADATRVGVAVCSAWPDAAGGGSNSHRSPATTRTGTTIRLINGRMRVSIVKWISDNSLGLYLPNPIPTQ